MAEEALCFQIEGLIEDGEAVPEPSSLDTVMSDPENRDGVAILVVVKTQAVKAVRVNVTLPEDVLQAIDRYAQSHGYTRSGFFRSSRETGYGPDRNPRRVLAEIGCVTTPGGTSCRQAHSARFSTGFSSIRTQTPS